MVDATLSHTVRQQYRILAGALMGALVIIPIALLAVVGGDEQALQTPPTLWLVALPAAGVLVHVLLEAIGYRLPAVAAGTPAEEARREGLAQFMSAMVRRFALSEVVGIVSVALCFLVETGGYVLTLVGCATSLALMAVHVWPWRRPVERSVAALEREGAQTGIRETFGLAPRPGGAIQEL